MNSIVTSSNTTLPVGMVSDYNNTNASVAVKTYRLETSKGAETYAPTRGGNDMSFAQAVYGDGPYSLARPNSTSEILAQNIDLIA